MDVEVKGTIVSNDDAWIYDYFGIENTCPAKVREALEQAKGDKVTIQLNSGGRRGRDKGVLRLLSLH